SRAVVEERRIGGPEGSCDRRVALVAGGADGVEAAPLVLELASTKVDMAALELRAEELERIAHREQAVGMQRLARLAARRVHPRRQREDGFDEALVDEGCAIEGRGVGLAADGHRRGGIETRALLRHLRIGPAASRSPPALGRRLQATKVLRTRSERRK